MYKLKVFWILKKLNVLISALLNVKGFYTFTFKRQKSTNSGKRQLCSVIHISHR